MVAGEVRDKRPRSLRSSDEKRRACGHTGRPHVGPGIHSPSRAQSRAQGTALHGRMFASHLCGLPMFTCRFGKQNVEQGSGRKRLIRALGAGHRLRLRAPGGCVREEAGAVFSPGFCSLYEVPVGIGGRT